MKLTFIFGTRPEAIKLFPVWLEAKKLKHSVKLVFTGQHQDLVLPILDFFGMVPDFSLDAMTADQTLSGLSDRILHSLNTQVGNLDSDYVLVQGDTTSAFVGAYWAFCRRIRVAHIEAGLRTHDLNSPFPEEGNRQLVSRLACVHFAPTDQAARNLAKEGIAKQSIEVVGNSGIDALLETRAKLKKSARLTSNALSPFINSGSPLVLITAHRRESFGPGFEGICDGLSALAKARPDVQFIYPVHPNPNVRQLVSRRLAGISNIYLLDPLPYPDFVWLMDRSKLIITDSGGVQEEAPSMGKVVLVLRDKTERPEAVRAGFSSLVGCDSRKIFKAGLAALSGPASVKGRNPYGDGKTSKRILRSLSRLLRK